MTRTETTKQNPSNIIPVLCGIIMLGVICFMGYQTYTRFFPPPLNSYEIEVRYAKLTVMAHDAHELRANVEYECMKKADSEAKAVCLVQHNFAVLQQAEYKTGHALWDFERDYLR